MESVKHENYFRKPSPPHHRQAANPLPSPPRHRHAASPLPVPPNHGHAASPPQSSPHHGHASSPPQSPSHHRQAASPPHSPRKPPPGQRAASPPPYNNGGTSGDHKMVFNVLSFGAVGDGVKDDTKAFKMAWNNTCKTLQTATLLVPKGYSFMIQTILFTGPCKSNLIFQVEGTIMPPDGQNSWPSK
ncbi:Polygalacturonase [Quillaja saponaria]|uniref:Polygalacturonase n=1 Tax=Quillaja saponaria TaxID=32244 RepID=A0AAD7Q1R8_QUISA|nr:Polygalacturonase [Quillaja saponaria]